MAQGIDERTGGTLLAGIGGAIDALMEEPTGLLTGAEQLALLTESLSVGARFQAWQAELAAQVDAAEVAWQEHGTSTSTWLADAANLTRREAGRLIAAGQGLQRFPLVGEAAGSGAILPGQAEAITAVLDDLPGDFPAEIVTEAQQLMVGFAATHNSAELRKLTAHLVEVLAPDSAEAREEARLEREHRLAERTRHLTFRDDHHGSVLITGSLPVAEAEPFIQTTNCGDAAATPQRGVSTRGAPAARGANHRRLQRRHQTRHRTPRPDL